MKILSDAYEASASDVQNFEEMESDEMGDMSSRYCKLAAVENANAWTSSTGHHEKIIILRNKMRLFLNVPFRC